MDNLKNKIEIIPAIMPDSFSEIEEKVLRVSRFVKTVQLDIMDGKFVNEKTWPYKNNGNELERIIKEEVGLPAWESVNYEIDLMVENPSEDAYTWIKAGATRIIFHHESSPNILDIIKSIKKDFGDSKESPTAPEIGIAIDNNTPLSELENYLDKVDFVQMMGIDKIGYQGEPQSEKVIPRITEFRKTHPQTIISVDGAVNYGTARALVEAGAGRLVSGSYIFESNDIEDAIKSLSDGEHIR